MFYKFNLGYAFDNIQLHQDDTFSGIHRTHLAPSEKSPYRTLL